MVVLYGRTFKECSLDSWRGIWLTIDICPRIECVVVFERWERISTWKQHVVFMLKATRKLCWNRVVFAGAGKGPYKNKGLRTKVDKIVMISWSFIVLVSFWVPARQFHTLLLLQPNLYRNISFLIDLSVWGVICHMKITPFFWTVCFCYIYFYFFVSHPETGKGHLRSPLHFLPTDFTDCTMTVPFEWTFLIVKGPLHFGLSLTPVVSSSITSMFGVSERASTKIFEEVVMMSALLFLSAGDFPISEAWYR